MIDSTSWGVIREAHSDPQSADSSDITPTPFTAAVTSVLQIVLELTTHLAKQKDISMKLANIPPGSDIAYRSAAKLIAEQVEFELETCRRLLGTEPEKVLELLANTPDWSVFLDDEDL